VRDDLPVPNCTQCGRPIFDKTRESGAYRIVYATLEERAKPEEEARSIRLVHAECWVDFAEAHGIDIEP
jgi:hypothetical protein